ncbi:MAG: helix-turn-helix domain-containing protein [Chloroflexi bacterium]|nr:helix-turn-helix domain-containing protein [Chloroflexota bacterium]
MRDYGQFCPIAKAAEVFAQRWTPLILRELLMGSDRFNELERGLPRISRSMLQRRLRSLEDSGLLRRSIDRTAGVPRYRLTEAGSELFDVVKGLGDWGHRWVNHDVGPRDLNPDLLFWDMHRRINVELLPDRRVVARFELRGSHEQRYWLVFERPHPSVCYQDPELEVDIRIEADTLTLHQIWLGRDDFVAAIRRGSVTMDGPRELVRDLPGWFALSLFASIPSAV